MVIKGTFEISNTPAAAVIANFAADHRSRIYDAWKGVIKGKSIRGKEHLLQIIQREYSSNTDLLTILRHSLIGRTHDEKSGIHGLIAKMRTKEYSVSELFYEIFSLQDAFEIAFTELGSPGKTDITSNLGVTRNALGRIFAAVLEQTSQIYEHVTESGKRGFCQLDRDGHITYCNAEMERIFHGQDITGKRLEELVPENQRDYILMSISADNDENPGSRELVIPNKVGGATTVWAEIERIIIENECLGSYAMFTDISPVAMRESAVFDSATWCVVKIDSAGQITYANDEALSLFNIETYEGHQIGDFVKGKDRETLVNAIKARQQGKSSEYIISITPRGKNSKPIEIEICGIPITDTDGHPVGSIGIFHSRMINKTSEAIYTQIAGNHNPEEMLKATAKIVREIIPFDLCIVTRYSTTCDGKQVYANPFFTFNPEGKTNWSKRWSLQREDRVQWIKSGKIEPSSLDKFLQREESKDLKDSTDIKNLKKQNFNFFIFRVVKDKDGNLVSSFALMRKGDLAFDNKSCDLLQTLPLDQAMLMALHQYDINEKEFRYKLIKSLVQAPSLADAADIYVHMLQVQYDWDHVSLFRVDRYREKFVLQKQATKFESVQLPEDYNQPIDEGMLGKCLADENLLNYGDVSSSDLYKKDINDKSEKQIHSELCCPIWTDGKINWILNIEDTHIDALSPKQVSTVEEICEEFGSLIERLARHFSFQACFDSTTDPVIITDNANNILRTNEAAKAMLGNGDNAGISGSLEMYFKDKQQARLLLDETRSAPTEVSLHNEGMRKDLNILMSCCKLPDEFGEKVYISKDLSRLRRAEELNYLSQLSYEVASQSQSSLSLAFTWLRRLRDAAASSSYTAELADKIMRQLHKVQVTHDRMAFYDNDLEFKFEEPINLNLVTEIKRMLDDFPESDATLVTLPDDKALPYITADPVSIGFILESLFSYLLRYASEDRKIDINLAQDEHHLVMKIIGNEPVREIGNGPYDKFTERVRSDIAIGRRRLEQLIESQHGQFLEIERHGDQVTFQIQFPLSEMELAV